MELEFIYKTVAYRALKHEAETHELSFTVEAYEKAARIIDQMPTIKAEPMRRGRWIVHTTWHGMFGLIHSECSECKFDRNGDLSSWKFCPNCGARMNGGV